MTKKPSSNQPPPNNSNPSYTIDELAAKTGVPSRTIRFYQAKGAIKPPRKKGRVAYYNDKHIKRLELVSVLQDRGLNLRAIAELVAQLDNNVPVSEWLGVGEKLQASWTSDVPAMYNEDELKELIGASFRPGMLAELERIEIIRREGASRPANYLVPSPGILKIAMRLHDGGFDLEMVKQANDIIRKRLGKMVDEIMEFFRRYLTRDLPMDGLKKLDPVQIGHSVQTVRDIAFDATRLILAQEIERSMREMAEMGWMTASKRARRHRRK